MGRPSSSRIQKRSRPCLASAVQASLSAAVAFASDLSAVPRPPSVRYTELSSILQDEIHAAITGIKSAEQALNDACGRIDALGQ